MTRLFNWGIRTLCIAAITLISYYEGSAQCTSTMPGTKITVPCNIDTSTIPKPTIGSLTGCGMVSSVQLMLPTQIIMDSCAAPCFARMIRQWKLTISSPPGITFYFDTVCFTKITLANVKWPRDTVIICSNLAAVDTSVKALGSPLLAQGIPCNILQSSPTTVFWPATVNAKGCYHFTRTWHLIDWCTGQIKDSTQKVEVKDTTRPTIVVDHTPIQTSVTSDFCTASYRFPAASVFDNCTPANQIIVKITIPEVGLSLIGNGGVITGIPLSENPYKVYYTANDGCDNIAEDSTTILVFDGQAPIAICKGPKVIQLNDANGMVTLPAYAFDDGSFDKCSHYISFKVRRMNNLPKCVVESPDTLINNPLNRFADEVKFCCVDHNTDVMVVLRVYQGYTKDGPVSADEYPIHSDCMISVKVLDKAGPDVVCPAPDTIDCRDLTKHSIKNINDLLYGTPSVSDMCLDKVTIDSLPHLDACNVGYIIRRINAFDKAGNVTSCDQYIAVINNHPFNANDTSVWAWPKDTTFFICSASTATASTGLPKLKDPSCTKVAYSFEDEVYEFATGACKKIIRRWSVIDWCQISAMNPYKGKWQHMQTIVVMDTLAPVLTIPADFMVNNFDSLCGPALVNVPAPGATDCTPAASLVWTYSLDLFADGKDPIEGEGKSVSKLMPNGTHILTFNVSDNCGNTTSKSLKITVKDAKKPTPVAMNGLATDLSLMNGVAMVQVNARLFFLPGSVLDNCTPYSKLKFSYSTNVNDTLRVFTCDSIGTRTVRLWVTDEAGNQDRVTTYILIQNNMGACTNPAPTPAPELRTIGIGGALVTESNKPVEQAVVKIMQGDNALPDPSIAAGKYTVPDLLMGRSYDVIPKKDINPLNGVSTVDLIMMQKHILGIKPILSPYQLIAADIDKSGDINTVDLLELRKLLLGIDKHFSNNESWRFVDAQYKFNNINSTLTEPYNEKYSIKELSKAMQINFIGVKIGDINESNQSDEFMSLESRNVKYEAISIRDQIFKSNDIVKVNIASDALQAITGFQLSIAHQGLDFISVEPGAVKADMLFAHATDRGININGYSSNPVVVPTNGDWFTLVFKANTSGSLSQVIRIIDKPEFRPEVYDGQLSASTLNIKWLNASDASKFKMEQNTPNPFTNTTLINYFLPQTSWVNLKIYDLDGRVLFNSKVLSGKGQNVWEVDRSRLNANGIYYYRIETPYGTDANKMILLQ